MNRIRAHLLVLMVLLLTVSCQPGTDHEPDVLGTAVDEALTWAEAHPADLSDGGIIEVAEEIVAFHVLSRYAENAQAKDALRGKIVDRLDLIISAGEFTVQPQEVTMVLTLADIADELGLEQAEFFRRLIDEQLIPGNLLCPPHVMTCLWTALYMQRLGYPPSQPVAEILGQSTLAKEVRQRLLYQHAGSPADLQFINPTTITAYDLTHEVFALTDFGALPPPQIVVENRVFFSQLFDRLIEWAIAIKHLDILNEAIMCVKILDLEDVPSLQRGIEFTLSNQQGDGSFGVTNPARPNVFRHGVLVSTMALTMVHDDVTR